MVFLGNSSGKRDVGARESRLAVCSVIGHRNTRWDGRVRVWGGGLGLSLMAAFLPVLKRDGLSVTSSARGLRRRRAPRRRKPLGSLLPGNSSVCGGPFPERRARWLRPQVVTTICSRVAREAPRGKNGLKVQLCKALHGRFLGQRRAEAGTEAARTAPSGA